MKRSRLLCAVLCLLLCCGCAKPGNVQSNTQNENNAQSSNVSAHLLYCSTDSIDPFKCITQINQELSYLLYDPLIKLNSDFEAVYYLASSSKYEANICTVTLNSVTHSDGSQLTAEDVVFSANLAKASDRFSQQLANMASCTAVNSNTVQFTLTQNDPYFINLLDFPIIKNGSNTLVNEDNIALPPIGCGRYVFDTATETLNYNTGYYKGKAAINIINLIDAPDAESVSQRIRSGKISAYYSDLGNNEIPNMNGKMAEVPLNNLVYIGCNMKSGIFRNVYARQAVSSAINRSTIVKTAFYGNAIAATGPFHPNWEPAAKNQNILTNANLNLAVENFDRLGYNKDDEGFYLVSKNKRLSVSILVNEDNLSRMNTANMVASQLKQAGIDVTVNALPYANYVAALQNGQFDLYIAEVRIMGNMDIRELVTHGGSCAYGIAPSAAAAAETAEKDSNDANISSEPQDADPENTVNITTAQAAANYKNGSMSLQDLITVFNTEIPVIPICYRTGILLYNDSYVTNPTPSISDPYYNFEKFATK